MSIVPKINKFLLIFFIGFLSMVLYGSFNLVQEVKIFGSVDSLPIRSLPLKTKTSLIEPLLESTEITPVPYVVTSTPTVTPSPFPLSPSPTAVLFLKKPVEQAVVFPEISDSSVLQTLNQYRSDHKVHQLVEDSRLCQYAEKRVNDLVTLGKLDAHEGFKQDFASPDSLPESIKSYPGGKIGENLAYQHCRNMTTGDSFVAQTAASLIEWCFDSSTAGHREAQLNPNFNAVCVRHSQGFFVVIFGE